MDPSNATKMTRLDQKFEDHKDEIHQMYVKEQKTIKETMDFFEGRDILKARYAIIA